MKILKQLAVPINKSCGFCVMKLTTYPEKLNENIGSNQFVAPIGESDDLTMRAEKLMNRSLHQLKKQRKINEKIYHRLRKTGSQPPSFYGLAKVHKNDTPLRRFQSSPVSSYKNLNKFLSHF